LSNLLLQIRRSKAFHRARAWLIPLFESVAGHAAAGCLKFLRLFKRESTADFLARMSRFVGPYLKEHRIGRENLAAAFPDKTPEQIETILGGVWDNLGRFMADFAQLDRLRICDPDNPEQCEIEYTAETRARFEALQASEKPALLFAAHLANWEIPPLVARRYGIPASVLYRRPSMPGIAEAVVDMRAGCMGTLIPAGIDAPLLLAKALQNGGVAGMLADQHDHYGVAVQFFGRHSRVSPLLGRLARKIDCPIYGTRVVRLPNNRFRVDLTDPLTPPRDAEGLVDVQGAMQMVTSVIEGWVREHPEQWLWLHRRWRPDRTDPAAKRKLARRERSNARAVRPDSAG
jgi:KDO2-lipid IV(A) lauroyltransferase